VREKYRVAVGMGAGARDIDEFRSSKTKFIFIFAACLGFITPICQFA
jgi:hypothetical protein